MRPLHARIGADSRSSIETRREVVRLIGHSQLPTAVTLVEFGMFATFEQSSMEILRSLPDDLLYRMHAALEKHASRTGFMQELTALLWGTNIVEWLAKPVPIDRIIPEIDMLVRYADACEYASGKFVHIAANTVEGWTLPLDTESLSTLVTVMASALSYRSQMNDLSTRIPVETDPIVSFVLSHQDQSDVIAGIIKERGIDVDLIKMMLQGAGSLREGFI